MATKVPYKNLRGGGGRFTGRNQGIMWTGLEVIADNINKRGNSLNATRKRTIEKLAADMEAYAKANAPWNDRTGDARSKLRAEVVHEDVKQVSTAYLGHGVGYGVFLETMGGGQFAIIMPTIEAFRGRFMATLVAYDTADDVFERMYGE